MDYPKSDPAARLHQDKFTDGDPVNGILASRDSAKYQNMVFDELINVITGAGLNPDEGVLTQLLQAIKLGGRPARTLGVDDYIELSGGFIMQWGSKSTASGVGLWTFPIPFPNGCVFVLSGQDVGNGGSGTGANPSPVFGSLNNKTQAPIASELTSAVDGIYIMAIGF